MKSDHTVAERSLDAERVGSVAAHPSHEGRDGFVACQLKMSAVLFDDLEKASEQIFGRKDMQENLRLALACWTIVVPRCAEGARLLLRQPNGEEMEITFPLANPPVKKE